MQEVVMTAPERPWSPLPSEGLVIESSAIAGLSDLDVFHECCAFAGLGSFVASARQNRGDKPRDRLVGQGSHKIAQTT